MSVLRQWSAPRTRLVALAIFAALLAAPSSPLANTITPDAVAAAARANPAVQAVVSRIGPDRAARIAQAFGPMVWARIGEAGALPLAARGTGGAELTLSSARASAQSQIRSRVGSQARGLAGVSLSAVATAGVAPDSAQDREGAAAEDAILREFDLDAVAAAADRLADRKAAAEIHTVIAALERIEDRATGPRLPARFQTGFVVIPDLVAWDPHPEPQPGARQTRVHTPLTLGRVQFN